MCKIGGISQMLFAYCHVFLQPQYASVELS